MNVTLQYGSNINLQSISIKVVGWTSAEFGKYVYPLIGIGDHHMAVKKTAFTRDCFS